MVEPNENQRLCWRRKNARAPSARKGELVFGIGTRQRRAVKCRATNRDDDAQRHSISRIVARLAMARNSLRRPVTEPAGRVRLSDLSRIECLFSLIGIEIALSRSGKN